MCLVALLRPTDVSFLPQFSPDLLRVIRLLIEEEGELRISSFIRSSTSLPYHIQELTLQYVDCICREFRSAGAEA